MRAERWSPPKHLSNLFFIVLLGLICAANLMTGRDPHWMTVGALLLNIGVLAVPEVKR